jgi:hypothetical protein
MTTTKRYGRPPGETGTRFTVTLPDEDARQIRAYSLLSGTPMTDVIAHAVRTLLAVVDQQANKMVEEATR